MAHLRYVVLLIASAFLVLQLSEQVAAVRGSVTMYDLPYTPSACFGSDPDQLPSDLLFAAAADNFYHNTWADGKNCGKFFTIQCIEENCRPRGPIRVKIIDRCPDDCDGRAFKLSPIAFNEIAYGGGAIRVLYSLDEKDAETFIAEVGHIGQ